MSYRTLVETVTYSVCVCARRWCDGPPGFCFVFKCLQIRPQDLHIKRPTLIRATIYGHLAGPRTKGDGHTNAQRKEARVLVWTPHNRITYCIVMKLAESSVFNECIASNFNETPVNTHFPKDSKRDCKLSKSSSHLRSYEHYISQMFKMWRQNG